MAIPARITFLTIGAHDMAVMRAFYRGIGWTEKPDSTDGFASFEIEGMLLALFPFAQLAGDGRVPAGSVGRAFRGVAFGINVESRERVDATIAELRAQGARITKEPREESWGGRSAYFADPEGNLWEVAYAPGAFDDTGKFTLGA